MNNLNKKNETAQEEEKKIDNSRRAIARAGAITPLMMTLISKTALGQSYHCTPSGMQSGNLSTHPDTIPCEGAGFTAVLEWHDNAENTSGNGCVDYWLDAGLIPFDIKIKINKKGIEKKKIHIFDIAKNKWRWKTNADAYDQIFAFAGENAEATLFADIFGSGSGTLWENLTDSSIESDAATAYLNASLNVVRGEFNPVYEDITPEDIVNFYVLAINGAPGFTTSSGTVIDSSFNAAYYLAGIIIH